MKKISSRVVPLAVLLVAFGLVLAGCSTDDNTDNSTEVTYTSKDVQDNVYKLVITKDPNRAYAPHQGDTFTLTVTNSSGTVIASSTGKVTTISGGSNFMLKLDSDITIDISSGAISTITGNIPKKDGSGNITSPTMVPPNDTPSNSLSGKSYYKRDNLLEFSGSTFSLRIISGPEMSGGTYAVSGSTVTFTLTWVTDSFKEMNVGATFTGMLSSNGKELTITGETWTEADITIPNTPSSGLSGVYQGPNTKNILAFLTFSDLHFTMTRNGTKACEGTYAVSGSTVTLTITEVSDDFKQNGSSGATVGDTLTGTLSSNGKELTIKDETWKKQQ